MSTIRIFSVIALAATLILAASDSVEAKKIGYKLKAKSSASRSSSDEQEMTAGSFMVASQFTDCNNGYRLEQISFSGFDKPQQSNTETFFITNHTDRTMSGVNIYIEYLDSEGRQLNKRFVRLTCSIPPGETRYAEVPTWDKQRAFYYKKSQASKKGGAPFDVRIDPVAFYLRF